MHYLKGINDRTCICELKRKTLTKVEILKVVQFFTEKLNYQLSQTSLLSNLISHDSSASSSCIKFDLEPIPEANLYKMETFGCEYFIKGSLQRKNFIYKNSKVVFSFSMIESCRQKEPVFSKEIFVRKDEDSRFQNCIPKNFIDSRICICS